jgi:hypothetical protein
MILTDQQRSLDFFAAASLILLLFSDKWERLLLHGVEMIARFAIYGVMVFSDGGKLSI